MILPRFGNWSHTTGRWLLWERLYNITKNQKPTIWCRVSIRYLRSQKQMSMDRRMEKTKKTLAHLFSKDEKLVSSNTFKDIPLPAIKKPLSSLLLTHTEKETSEVLKKYVQGIHQSPKNNQS